MLGQGPTWGDENHPKKRKKVGTVLEKINGFNKAFFYKNFILNQFSIMIGSYSLTPKK